MKTSKAIRDNKKLPKNPWREGDRVVNKYTGLHGIVTRAYSDFMYGHSVEVRYSDERCCSGLANAFQREEKP